MYKRLRNLFYFGAIAILIAAAVRVVYMRSSRAANSQNVLETTTVDRGEVVLTVSATGPILAQKEVALAFPAVGKVARVQVSVGQHVLAGQTLAALDTQAQETALQNARLALNAQRIAYNALVAAPRDLDLKSAEATLASARAQLGAANIGYDPLQVKLAELQVELSKNQLWQAQLNRDMAVANANAQQSVLGPLNAQIALLPEPQRSQAQALLAQLSGLGAGFTASPRDAEAQVQSAEYSVKVAQAQLSQVRNQGGNLGSIAAAQLAITSSQTALDKLLEGPDANAIAIAEAQIRAAQAALDLAAYTLSRSTLVATFDGVVAQIDLVEGEPAPLDKPAILLIDDSRFHIDLPVDEVDIARVAPGQPVTLAFDSLPGEVIRGRVSRVAETALTIGDVVTYSVRVDVEPTGQPLRSGMSATATITVSELKDVLRIRNRFVRLDRKTGKASVTRKAPDGTLTEVDVKLGLRNEAFSEIVRGLAEGDVIVVLPRSNLLGQ